MKKFLFLLLSVFSFESVVISGPVLSVATHFIALINDCIINDYKEELWIEYVKQGNTLKIKGLLCAHPELIDKKFNFIKPWENKNETTALHYAITKNDINTASILLNHGADAKIKDDNGLHAYQIAEQSNSKPIRSLISSPKTQRKYYQRKSS